jgi:mannitol/fructose-specific phosphotransferase system IIA component (Ntr-type)
MKENQKDTKTAVSSQRVKQKESNKQYISDNTILTQVESDTYFEDIEERKAETTTLRRPQFRINENSRRRFY